MIFSLCELSRKFSKFIDICIGNQRKPMPFRMERPNFSGEIKIDRKIC